MIHHPSREDPAPDGTGLEPYRCICGAGDTADWHSLMCVASNTPDDIWHASRCPSELHRDWDDRRIELRCEREVGHPGPHAASQSEWEW